LQIEIHPSLSRMGDHGGDQKGEEYRQAAGMHRFTDGYNERRREPQ
jgi:hypothetical protein